MDNKSRFEAEFRAEESIRTVEITPLSFIERTTIRRLSYHFVLSPSEPTDSGSPFRPPLLELK
jgi:hypothetical protein